MDEGQQQLQQQGGDAGAAGQDQGGGTFAPGAMLWLIQRDFLQVGVAKRCGVREGMEAWEVWTVLRGRSKTGGGAPGAMLWLIQQDLVGGR